MLQMLAQLSGAGICRCTANCEKFSFMVVVQQTCHASISTRINLLHCKLDCKFDCFPLSKKPSESCSYYTYRSSAWLHFNNEQTRVLTLAFSVKPSYVYNHKAFKSTPSGWNIQTICAEYSQWVYLYFKHVKKNKYQTLLYLSWLCKAFYGIDFWWKTGKCFR